MSTNLARGDHAPLPVTKEARHRVYVGLRWDPREAQTIWEKLNTTHIDFEHMLQGQLFYKVPLHQLQHDEEDPGEASAKGLTYDLDLSCVAFDGDGRIIDKISPALFEESGEQLDHKIYHSGDDRDGSGDGLPGYDDERVYAELRDMPEEVKDILFFVTSKNKFDLDDVANPEIRLVDSKTEREIMKQDIGQAGIEHPRAFVYLRIYRKGDDWMMHNISEYLEQDSPEALELALGTILSAAR